MAESALQLRELLDANPMVGEAKPTSRRFWTGREHMILRNHYPQEGLAGCVQRLPGRTASSIYQQARILGLVSPAAGRQRGPRQSWPTSDAIDAVIRQNYPRATHKNDVLKLARTVGRPRWWVTRRARALGLVAPRFREPPWTPEEEDLILEQAHRSLGYLRSALKRMGHNRSETAIAVKLKRLGADRTDPDHFTGRQLAEVMGVDSKTVTRWIVNGWLKAKRRGTERTEVQGGDQWWIHRRDVRAFIIGNVAAVDIRKVEKHWFVDLLAGVSER